MNTKGLVFFTTVVATTFGLFGTPEKAAAAAPAVVNVTRASQVTAGDGQIAAHGSYSVATGNTYMMISVKAKKTDAPNIGQENSISATKDPGAPTTDWGATILVTAGTWDVTATILTVDANMVQTTTLGTGSVTGVVVKDKVIGP